MLVEGTPGPATEPNESATLPFVIPSEAEGSAVHSVFATKLHGAIWMRAWEQQVAPLRYAPVGMTNSLHPGGPKAHDHSG